ncbi:MAG: Copper resistance protein [Rhodocyclaceae bacterium]|nr:Copper resistance protein [Rhodocyclaceae bacterium]
MRKHLLPLLMCASFSILAADEQVIELKDGGRVTVDAKGHMVHMDAAGKRVKMKDGVVMEGKDGSKYMMKNDAIWKQIMEKGSLNPKL